MATVGLIGKKLGQTRVYDDTGAVVCVTVVRAGPNRVVQCKTEESDGYNAVQLGYGEQPSSSGICSFSICYQTP